MTELLEKWGKHGWADEKSEHFCNEEKSPIASPMWKAKIHRIDGHECDAKYLLQSMETDAAKAGGVTIPMQNGKAITVKQGSKFPIDDCTPTIFPFETHHLIPKNTLNQHDVCRWLTKHKRREGKPSADNAPAAKYALERDTKYSTDHWKNGLCLPTPDKTDAWNDVTTEAKKTRAYERLMEKTEKQAHKGGHSDKKTATPTTKGYISQVNTLLDLVADRTLAHVEGCNICKVDTTTTPIKVQPLDRVVNHVDGVSRILEARIAAKKIFVSRQAADYWSGR